ncbi:alpha-D-ribose 1-methylphosphonate 5-triphosphate diphosphatase [Primorskyibacter sp. 2E107]|uniref:alpha-D-ribose 1-methylphosphonate 5-triphosphate diphosphatase n=1 Tax=Primorskyibacter sp. 2E107 TaxID=3403458 RepID=UPI003AF6A1DE
MNSPLFSADLASSQDALTTGSVCLANARLVLPEREMTGSITIEDGIITEIAEGDRCPDGAIDCMGDHVTAGLVELHTDNLERHLEPRPGVDWPHLSAILSHDGELASAGITTVFDALRAGSIHTGKAGYGQYARAVASEITGLRTAGALRISHFLHLRAEICSETLLEEMAEFTADDRVGIVSLMDHTPGQRQFRDLSKLKQYVAKKRNMTDAEFEAHIAHLLGLQARNGERHEAGAVVEARRLGAVLASHDDTSAAQVTGSARNGVGFAEFPTTVEAAEACREEGIAIMMGAPNIIRGGSHSGNVSALTLAELGLLDIVSSDYVPSALLLSAFRLRDLWQDLPRAMRTVTAAPAEAAGLNDRGALRLGLRGDLLRVGTHQGTPLLRGVWSRGRQVG